MFNYKKKIIIFEKNYFANVAEMEEFIKTKLKSDQGAMLCDFFSFGQKEIFHKTFTVVKLHPILRMFRHENSLKSKSVETFSSIK